MTKKKSQVENVADKCEEVGNQLFDTWKETGDLNVIKTGINAFKTTIAANSLILQAKRLTGEPTDLPRITS